MYGLTGRVDIPGSRCDLMSDLAADLGMVDMLCWYWHSRCYRVFGLRDMGGIPGL